MLAQFQKLQEIGADLARPRDRDALLLRVVEAAMALTGARYASIGFVEGDVIHWQSAAGKPIAEVRGYKLPIGQGLCGWVVRNARARRSGDVTSEPDYVRQYAEMHSEVDVPIMVGQKVIGVLNAESPDPDAFGAEHESVMQILASYVAVALSYGQLYPSHR